MSATGIFEQWQPAYAEAGIATFPVGRDKVPCTKGHLRTGLRGSAELRTKFPQADAFGIGCGKWNRLTVFDYDAPDERGFRDVMDELGPSPFIVRSASGNFQAYYAHSGEKRMVRPDPSRPFDILGNGFVVGAPSRTAKGAYEIIQGSLHDLSSLPPMRLPRFQSEAAPVENQLPTGAEPLAPVATMKAGDGRNNALFNRLKRAARSATNQEDVIKMAGEINATFAEPLGSDEVARVAGSVWGYKDRGRLFNPGGEATAVIFHSDRVHLWDQPLALSLLVSLRMAHGHRNGDPFALSRAAAGLIGVSAPTYRVARDVLVDRRFIEIIHPGGKGKNDPPIARLL